MFDLWKTKTMLSLAIILLFAIPMVLGAIIVPFGALDQLPQIIATVEDIVTIIAIILAGLVAGASVVLVRPSEPNISVSHQIGHRTLNQQEAHVRIEAKLHNTSRVPVQIRRSSISVERLVRTTAGHYEYAGIGGNLLRDRSTTFAQHSILYNREFHLADLEVIIESGQSRQETFEIIIDPDNVPIRIHTRFRGGLPNAQEASDKDWEAISFYDID